MAVDVKNLIGAISPKLYCDDVTDPVSGEKNKDVVKDLVKEKGYLEASKKVKLKPINYLDVAHVRLTKNAFKYEGTKNPIEQHKLVYDASSQSLEEIYFWILDYVNENYKNGAEKLIDSFVSSSGSGFFSEMQGRATRMQEEGMKILGLAATVLRGILGLVYDLREFKLALAAYDDLKSKDGNINEAAMLALKQRWLDQVDIKKGNGSIKAMAQQFDFVTLMDAFFAAKSLDNIAKIDLNDRVRRILEQRYRDFDNWLLISEDALRKRYAVEQIYLRSQVNTLKIYSRWAKPYLKAAKDLEQNANPNAALVNAFNTALFELVIMAKGKYDPLDDVATGDLPKIYKKLSLRKYYPISIVEFKFRSIPAREDQRGGYGYRGRIEVVFTSFALNDDELSVMKTEMDKDDFNDMYKLIGGATDESLSKIQEDLDEFLGKEKEDKKEEKKKDDDTNPFSALIDLFRKEKKEEKADLSKGISEDSEYEKVLRSQALLEARWKCRKLYDDYKKAHGMSAFPPSIN